MSDDLKIQGEVSLDTSSADAAFVRVDQGAERMAQGVRTAGQKASKAMEAIGEGGDQAAQKLDRVSSSIGNSIRRATASVQRELAALNAGGANSPDLYSRLIDVRGGDAQALRPLIDNLTQVNSLYSAVAATQKEAMAAAQFEREHQSAKALAQDAEYVRYWAAALEEKERIQAASQATALFEREHQAAKKLVQDAEYVRYWNDALQERERVTAQLGSQNAFIASLQKQSDAIGKSRADLLELQAAELGVADKAAPLIARMREAEQGVSKTGVSAAQTAAALRGIPAQVTDIVVSLQAGQAPLTVLLQQGGQLKDMFGGTGNAVKAIGGYALGLVNPITVSAAAVGALALAYYKGSTEGSEFTKQLILSGNAAGVASVEFYDLAYGVSQVVGTQGQAAEVLAQLVGTGRVARDVLVGAGAAIVAMGNVGGASVKDLVKDFESLGKKPSEALRDLSERYNFLTLATYRQVTALQEQGRVEDAAAFAQRAYSDMLAERAKSIQASLGLVERAWAAVRDTSKSALDSVFEIGRDLPIEVQIAKLSKAAADARARANGSRGTLGDDFFGASRRAAAEADDLDLQITRLRESRLRSGAAATTAANRQSAESAAIDAADALERQRKALLSGAQKIESELNEYRRRIGTIRLVDPNSPLLNPGLIAADEKAIRAKYVDKTATKEANEARRALEKYRDLVTDLAGEQDGLASNFNEQLAALYTGWKLSGDSAATYDRALAQLIEKQPFVTKAAKEQAEFERKAAEERRKRYTEIESLAEAEVKAALQSAKSSADRVLALMEEEQAIQRARDLNIDLAQALEEVRIARLGAAIASEQAKPDASQEVIDALAAEIRSRRELASLNGQKARREEANTDLKKFMTPDFNTDFSAGFDKSSQAAGTFVQTLLKLTDAQERFNRVKSDSKASQADLAKAEIGFQRAQLNGYASLAGAAKGFFREQSDGYRALQATEMAFRTYELASTAASLVQTGARTAAKATEALVAQLTLPFPANVPAFAATAAVLASLGLAASGGFGGGGGEAPVPLNTGTGTVFGDPKAQSESIAKSIDLLKDVDTLTMQYSAQMLASLRNIENALAGVTGQILRNGGSLTGQGFVGSSASNVPAWFQSATDKFANLFGSSGLGKLAGDITFGIPGKVLGGILGSTKSSLADSGLQFFGARLQDILAGGIGAAGYQTVETTKKALFGLSKSSSTSTSYTGLDASLTNQFTNLIEDTYDSIIAANKALGFSADETAAKIAGFTVDLGRISLKGLNGDQIQERLTAVFGAFADNLAMASASQYDDFQRAGEGYFETLVRVASGFEAADTLLGRMAVDVIALVDVTRTQGDVAAELVRQSLQAKEGLTGIADVLGLLDGTAQDIASAYTSLADARTTLGLLGLNGSAVDMSLLKGAGGIDALADSLKAFEDAFVGDSQKVTNQAVRMSGQFERLGLALPKSGNDFYSLVKGIDTSTEAGRTLLGSVLGLSAGFGELLDAINGVGSGIADEIERIKGLSAVGSTKSVAELQADFLIKSAQARAGDQTAIDLLPQISQALLKAAEATAGSSLDVAVLQARTLASLQATLDAISDPTRRLAGIPGFASGGSFSGGWRIVGENGPELEYTGPSRIYDANTTARIFGGADASSGELLRAFYALQQEVVGLRAELRSQSLGVVMVTNRVANVLERVCENNRSFNVRTVD